MKRFVTLFILCFAFGLCAGLAQAQIAVNNMEEPGSILVYPLIDNINYTTIVEITNRAPTDVWLQCYMITNEPAPQEKKDFYIHITQKEPFWWSTNTSYSRVDEDGVRTQIQSFAGRKGFLFCWAIDSDKTQLEIEWNHLKGDAMLYSNANGRSFQYNAIPHQGLAVAGDRVLNLDGVEYTAATSQIMFEGFAEGFSGIGGTLAVANLDIDFILSLQPPFDINLECWNQNEVAGTRHLHFKDSFMQYDLTKDLQLHINQVFTPKWQCATATVRPIWAVMHEFTGTFAWGSNVFQHPDYGVATRVVLAPVPAAQ